MDRAVVLRLKTPMTLAEVCEPAMRIARHGYRVSETFAADLAHHWDRLARIPETKRLFSREDGSPLQAGDLFRKPEFADTLTLIIAERPALRY